MTIKEYLIHKTTAELQNELAELDWMIEEYECYSTSDLILRENIENELAKRRDL